MDGWVSRVLNFRWNVRFTFIAFWVILSIICFLREKMANFPESPIHVSVGGWIRYLELCPKKRRIFLDTFPIPTWCTMNPYQLSKLESWFFLSPKLPNVSFLRPKYLCFDTCWTLQTLSLRVKVRDNYDAVWAKSMCLVSARYKECQPDTVNYWSIFC